MIFLDILNKKVYNMNRVGAKTDHLGRKVFDEIQLRTGLMNRTFTYHEGAVTKAHETAGKQVSEPTTTLVKEIRFHDGRTIAYEYDEEERIIYN